MITCQIKTINEINKSVFTITVEATQQSSLFPFTPGAETRLQLDSGEILACAVCSDPYDRTRYELLPLTPPAQPEIWREGVTVTVTRPRNPFPLLHCQELILIAGGRGIGQLIPMVRERARLAMPFELHYLTTADAPNLFVDELRDLAALSGSQLYLYDGAEQAAKFAPEYLLGAFDSRKHVYVSGEADMVCETMMVGGRLGWRASHIHTCELPDADNNRTPLMPDMPAALDKPERPLAPVYQLFR